MLKPWKHQEQTINFFATRDRGNDFSDPGCVSAETEFLSPTGWIPICEYKEQCIAEFDPSTRTISWVQPLEYIKKPCTELIAIAPVRGTSQRLSAEHRVLYFDTDGNYAETSAGEFMERLHKVKAALNKRKFASSFRVKGRKGIELSDAQLRIMVAVIADGHFYKKTANCVVRVKKIRKIERLRSLLFEANIKYIERQCGGDTSFQVFRFEAPRYEKHFTSSWWDATQSQLYIIADELPHWDGSERKANSTSFCSTIKESAEFAQYAFSATGNTASLSHTVRTDKTDTYDVHVIRGVEFVGPGRASSVFKIPNPEGFKYCFSVPSTYWLARHNGHIFATGNTGKTRGQIATYRNRVRPGRALVLCPKTLMYAAWAVDIEKFGSGLTASLAYADNREEAFRLKSDIVITNIDAVKWLAANSKLLKDFDHCIIDESTAYKHPTSQRSKALLKIRKHFQHRYCMTGTPNPISVIELWNPMMFVDDGVRLGTSYFKLRNAMQTPTQVGPDPRHLRWDDKPGAAQAVDELISDITIRHAFEDVMTDVPANHRDTKIFQLSRRAKQLYTQMENDAVLLFEDSVVNAVHAASMRTKLLQMASGAVYSGNGDRHYELIDNQRYGLIADLVDEREHSVVFFNWTHQRDELSKEFDKRGYSFALIDGSVSDRERDRIVQDFQRGMYKTLLLHPKTGAHGLTLTQADTTIISSPIYEADLLKQAIHRVYRGGQTKVTNTILVEAADTVERQVYERLFAKEERMIDLLELIKGRHS